MSTLMEPSSSTTTARSWGASATASDPHAPWYSSTRSVTGSQVVQAPAQHPGLDPPRGEEEVAHRAPMAALTRLARGPLLSPILGRGGNCGCRRGVPPFPRLRGRGGRGVRGPDPEGASANPA